MSDNESIAVRTGESKQWCPSQWTPEHIERFGRHVQSYAIKLVDASIGARIKSEMDHIRTVAALRARGVKMVGDK